MCVVSMVYDNFGDRLAPWTTSGGAAIATPPSLAVEIAELRQVLNEFREALKAAKTVDRLTGQPDCVDPEKAKLEERVAALEKLIDGRRRKRMARR